MPTDSERLDLIAAKCGGDGKLLWLFEAPDDSWYSEEILEGKEGQDLRAAIDAALSERAEGKETK